MPTMNLKVHQMKMNLFKSIINPKQRRNQFRRKNQ